jgi:hypothetical protein
MISVKNNQITKRSEDTQINSLKQCIVSCHRSSFWANEIRSCWANNAWCTSREDKSNGFQLLIISLRHFSASKQTWKEKLRSDLDIKTHRWEIGDWLWKCGASGEISGYRASDKEQVGRVAVEPSGNKRGYIRKRLGQGAWIRRMWLFPSLFSVDRLMPLDRDCLTV